jgi:3-phenylpropionate/trans-cinnamate dioxygenase alpha subunit
MAIDDAELRSLVNWEQGIISPRIFADEEIYRSELKNLFTRTWLFLAHDSMIPNPRDFITTYMGADPIIVSRQRDGSVKAMLNVCRHRGMKLCRADEGNTKVFTCTNHGWAFNEAGELFSVPAFQEAYLGELDMAKFGLRQPRVEQYKGFWFGNWDPGAPPLDEYLGDMKWYLDSWIDHADGGIEFLPNVLKWTIKANWKMAAEQFAGDAYHAPVTHASSMLNTSGLGFGDEPPPPGTFLGGQFSSPEGHGLGIMPAPPGTRLTEDPVHDYNLRKNADAKERLGDVRASIQTHFTVFPNLSGLGGMSTLGVWHPKGPNKFEIWRYAVVEKNAPDYVKRHIQRSASFTDGAGGTVEMDDGENWNLMGQVLSEGHMARETAWNYQMGLGHDQTEVDGFPGRVTPRLLGEYPQRQFYRRWLDFMTVSDRWPEPASFTSAST